MSICDRCKHYVVCEYVDENDGDTCDYFKMKSQEELLEDEKSDGMNVSQTFVDEWIGEQQHGRDGKAD